PLTPKGELLKISSLKKSPLGDLGVKRLFRLHSMINVRFFLRLKFMFVTLN
ncbi:MAG: hypothetical protein PWQ17_2607, partial [Anaerophaga sp.]|nr:hypothetical protein [Anaerophaga sp.]